MGFCGVGALPVYDWCEMWFVDIDGQLTESVFMEV